MFESVNTRTDAQTTDGKTPTRLVYNKVTSEPLAQVSENDGYIHSIGEWHFAFVVKSGLTMLYRLLY